MYAAWRLPHFLLQALKVTEEMPAAVLDGSPCQDAHKTYRCRSAMREMGKVLNLPQDVIKRFTDLYANGDFPHTLKLEQQIKLAGLPVQHPRLGFVSGAGITDGHGHCRFQR